MTKPRLIKRAGVWCVETPAGNVWLIDDYWILHDLAINWCVAKWKEEHGYR